MQKVSILLPCSKDNENIDLLIVRTKIFEYYNIEETITFPFDAFDNFVITATDQIHRPTTHSKVAECKQLTSHRKITLMQINDSCSYL